MIVAGASAYPRTIDFEAFACDRARGRAPGCWSTWRTSPDWWPRGIHPSPVPHADVVTTTTHKTLRGPAGRLDPVPARSTPRRSTSRCSRSCRAGRSCTSSRPRPSRSARRSQPAFATTPGRWSPTPRRSGEALPARGFHLVSGGTDNHLLLVDLRPSHPELTGKDAEARARGGGDHGEQEHGAGRDPLAVRDVGAADRDAGAHDPGHGRSPRWNASPSGSPTCSRRPRTRADRARAARGARPVRALPAVRGSARRSLARTGRERGSRARLDDSGLTGPRWPGGGRATPLAQISAP